MLINIPTFKVLVRNEYITDNELQGYTEGYLVAVRCIKSRPLLFSVHLENGALYSGLPINSLCTKKCMEYYLDVAQPWSCLESPCNALTYYHLKDYDVEVTSDSISQVGRYLFTIDYQGEGLAQDPEQHKTHNIIALESGQLVAMPNNYCKFVDQYFTDKDMETSHLRRTTSYYRTK